MEHTDVKGKTPGERLRKRGTSIVELLLVIGVIAIITGTGLLNLVGRRSRNEFVNTESQIAAVLRDAQSRSVTQADDSSWGVHFENNDPDPSFFALFRSSYSTSTRSGYYTLPSGVGFATSSIPAGNWVEIAFEGISGQRTGSSSVSVYLKGNDGVSATISVSPSGVVSH